MVKRKRIIRRTRRVIRRSVANRPLQRRITKAQAKETIRQRLGLESKEIENRPFEDNIGPGDTGLRHT